MIEKWPVTIPALTGRRYRRSVYVHLPPQAEDPEARFPVLYMFDGHNVFYDEDATYGKAWGLGDYLDTTELPLMVVAVECSHRPPHERLDEYSPWSFSDAGFGDVEGKGDITLRWMAETLKRRIDRRYPTLRDRENTFIAGSSMGGLMSLYALLSRPDIYRGAAALSPSLWTAPEQLQALIRKAEIRPDSVLYMDYGGNELARDPRRRRSFGSVTSALIHRGMNLPSRIVPEGEHCEASWERQIPFFLSTLLYQ